jgi:undecaprenyl-diphosphatase
MTFLGSCEILKGMQNLDQSLFILINSDWSNALFDSIMPVATDLHKNPIFQFWILPPLLVFWMYRRRGEVLPVFLGVALCIALVDNFTYRVLKPSFQRERPPAVETTIELRTDRYAGYGFPSNHAANNFAGAAFFSYCYPALTPVYFGIAGLVAYSRVYVGVHYPGDVIAGALLGLFFGLFFFRFWVIIWARVTARWPVLSFHQSHRRAEGTHGVQSERFQAKNR